MGRLFLLTGGVRLASFPSFAVAHMHHISKLCLKVTCQLSEQERMEKKWGEKRCECKDGEKKRQ